MVINDWWNVIYFIEYENNNWYVWNCKIESWYVNIRYWMCRILFEVFVRDKLKIDWWRFCYYRN